MSDFPIALHGERIRAVVIGGGSVGTRKALALADAGAQRQRRVAGRHCRAGRSSARCGRSMSSGTLYRADHLERATLVIAATDSREINALIASDANARGKLVNITDFPDEGNFHTMALHRSGDVTIAVSAGGVPGAAARIRDAIAERFDGRYERAVSALRGFALEADRSPATIAGATQRRRSSAMISAIRSRMARSVRRSIRGADRRRSEPHDGSDRGPREAGAASAGGAGGAGAARATPG